MFWSHIFKAVILILGIVVLAFNAQLYIFCKKQSVELSSMSDKLEVESEFNSSKFKYEQDQIERLSKYLEDAQQEIKDQNDALLQEAEKRQQVESESNSVQISLVDIKAEADAIKQDMKEWQKDYVSVLAEIEKKMDDSQGEMVSVNDSINALKADIEKITPAQPIDQPVKDKSDNQS